MTEITRKKAIQYLSDQSNMGFEKMQEIVTFYHEHPDKELKDLIILKNKSLVFRCANVYRGQSFYEDIIQEGTVGLIKALDKYDPAIGTKFSTFAYPYIDGYMKSLANSQSVVYFNHQDRDYVRDGKKFVKDYYQQTSKFPSEEEIANHLKMSLRRYHPLHLAIMDNYLHSFYDSDDAISPGMSLSNDFRNGNTITNAAQNIYTDEVNQILIYFIRLAIVGGNEQKLLSCSKKDLDRNCEIAIRAWGLNGKPRQSCKDLAKEYGVSHQRIHQILGNILRVLRYPEFQAKLRQALEIPTDIKNRDIANYCFSIPDEDLRFVLDEA